MVDPSKVEVSPDGQWVYDGYQWWPLAQVPPGTQTAQGYVWDGQQWHPPAQQPAQKKGKAGLIGGIILAGVVAVVIIGIFGVLSGGSPSSNPGSVAASSSPSNGVDKGLGSKDASADATVGPLRRSDFGAEALVKVTNSSEKRSNYAVDLSAVSADSKTQYATTMVYIENVDPGQSAQETASFLEQVPAGAKVTIKTVERTSAVG